MSKINSYFGGKLLFFMLLASIGIGVCLLNSLVEIGAIKLIEKVIKKLGLHGNVIDCADMTKSKRK